MRRGESFRSFGPSMPFIRISCAHERSIQLCLDYCLGREGGRKSRLAMTPHIP